MPKPPTLTAACSHCGVSFTYERLGNRHRKYCTPCCSRQAAAARVVRGSELRAGNANCEHCGAAIDPSRPPRRYCSAACRHQAYNRSEAGKARELRRKPVRIAPGAPGKSLRQQVFDRDGWRCRRCGCEVQMERPAAIDSATMRLIEPASRGGQRSLSNAETVCRRCCGELGAIASKAKLNSNHVLEGAPSSSAAEFLELPPPLSATKEPGLVSLTASRPHAAAAATEAINSTHESDSPRIATEDAPGRLNAIAAPYISMHQPENCGLH